VPDEEKPVPAEEQPDDSEARFWERLGQEFDQRSEAAFDRYLAKISGEIDDEEAAAKAKPAPKAKQEDEGGETERLEQERPSEAERRRASGGVGPGQPSGYWDRIGHRLLYGNRTRRG
jgi:hypothetical protein